MTKAIGYCTLICCASVVIVLAAAAPNVISDSNSFFRGFVNHEMLSILGFILAITLGSAAQLHLTLNGIEERLKIHNLFERTRAGLRSSIYCLIALFLFALLIAVLKPIVATTERFETVANGASLLIIIWNVLLLISLTQAVFAVRSFPEEGNDG